MPEEETHLVGALTTVTFFKVNGSPPMDYLHQDWLRTKITQMVRFNPWLLSCLERDADSNMLELVYPAEPSEEEIAEIIDIQSLQDAFNIHWDTPYSGLCKAIDGADAAVPPGSTTINEPTKRVKFTIVPLEGSTGFALIFSMCRVLGDAYTYYKILNMVSREAKVETMEPKRQMQFSQKIKKAQDADLMEWVKSGASIFNSIRMALFGRSPEIFLYSIHSAKMAETKTRIYSAGTDGTGKPASPNDIITSNFLNLKKNSSMGMMSINWRGKLPGLNDSLAGNYEGARWYDEEGREEALGIRKSMTLVSGVWRGCKAAPSTLAALRGRKLSVVTNWASLSKDLLVDGFQHWLHVPISLQTLPFDSCIIFRPAAQQLAILSQVRGVGRKQLCEGMGVLGEPLLSDASDRDGVKRVQRSTGLGWKLGVPAVALGLAAVACWMKPKRL